MFNVCSARMESKHNQFSCPACGENFTIKSNLLRHIRMKHRVDAEEYKCNTCNYSTKRSDLFVRHKRKCDLKKQHQCKNCVRSNSKRKRSNGDEDKTERALNVKKQKTGAHNHAESRNCTSMFKCRRCEFRCPNRAVLYKHHHQVFIIFFNTLISKYIFFYTIWMTEILWLISRLQDLGAKPLDLRARGVPFLVVTYLIISTIFHRGRHLLRLSLILQ
jgi:predicted RNA-binding Zn-ribbon protein involved in translation (DUF1610 family)